MEKPRKTRKSTPKTKTGCITCKLRRVKCGEERPFCQRCIKFGVSCDGYSKRSTHGKAAKAAFPVKIAPRAVTTSYFTNEEEHQYFTLFCSSTSLEILPGFDSGSTRQALLQLCHFKSSIRHAIIAIGALEKTYSVTPNLSRLSLDDREWATKANKHHKAALKQYSEAISHMSKDVSSHQNSLRTTLLACLLILCFEAWNGNLKLAVGQVRAGIALILEWKAAHGGLNDARLSSEPGIIEADLIQIFCRLAIQSIFFGFELTAPSRSLLGAEGRSLVRSMPTAFVDLSHAATYQQSLIRRGTYLFGAHVRTYPSFVNHTILPELFAAQVEFRADSLKWLQAFDPLFTSAPPGRRSPCVERKSDADHAWGILRSKPLTSCARYSLQFARMMKLQVLISYAYASTAFSTNDDAHEEYRDCWNVGVRLAEEVLTDKYWAKDDKPANYCFDSRVVMPLWMAGIHCRDDMRRNKVIELLLKFPRREGIWDSIWAGKMLQWVAGLERCFRGLDGHIPEWARIRDLKWTSDFEKRSSLLSCRQRISSSSLDVEEKTTRVFW